MHTDTRRLCHSYVGRIHLFIHCRHHRQNLLVLISLCMQFIVVASDVNMLLFGRITNFGANFNVKTIFIFRCRVRPPLPPLPLSYCRSFSPSQQQNSRLLLFLCWHRLVFVFIYWWSTQWTLNIVHTQWWGPFNIIEFTLLFLNLWTCSFLLCISHFFHDSVNFHGIAFGKRTNWETFLWVNDC